MRSSSLVGESKPVQLNISSLMDILTILLLFLILSFGSQEEDVLPPNSVVLPDSDSEAQPKVTLKVVIGNDELWVEDKSVLKFDAGQRLNPKSLDSLKMIKPLLDELRRRKTEIRSSQSVKEGNEEEQGIIFLHAAKESRYDLIQLVLSTAAEAGFAKFRLAVHRRG
jgi:biopolymer transport protein ExbD